MMTLHEFLENDPPLDTTLGNFTVNDLYDHGDQCYVRGYEACKSHVRSRIGLD